MDSNINKDYSRSAKEALLIIRDYFSKGINRITKQELTNITYEFIFCNEYNKELNSWKKVKKK
jgi:hypothetical protein